MGVFEPWVSYELCGLRERQNVIVDLFLEGVTCLLLVDPDNGQVIVGGVTVGSTARYICQSGFVLQGSDETTCLSSGTWSNLPPVCVAVNCADLPEPFNGEIIYSRETSETVNVFGSTATYRSPSLSLSLSFSLYLFFFLNCPSLLCVLCMRPLPPVFQMQCVPTAADVRSVMDLLE